MAPEFVDIAQVRNIVARDVAIGHLVGRVNRVTIIAEPTIVGKIAGSRPTGDRLGVGFECDIDDHYARIQGGPV